jgi:hypothetical protein
MAKQVTVDRVTEARPYPFAKLPQTQQGRRGRSDGLLSLRCAAVSFQRRSRALPCHTMGRAGLNEARCVAILSGQRSPIAQMLSRAIMLIKPAFLSYRWCS